jgi:F0F1-type ATP synthase membrane subunit b/b'
MFLTVDGTIWIQLINFAIFFAVLNVVFLRPVGAAIRKRREYIDSVHHDYERYTRRVRELRAEAEARRAAARREAEERVARARAEANDAAQGTAAEYARRAAKLIADAQRTVSDEVAAARVREPELSAALGRSLLDRAVEELAR